MRSIVLLNTIINRFQLLLNPIYNKSKILQNIDRLTGLSIFCVIFSSLFAQSDNIGIFALCAIILTTIKILTKNGEKFELTVADKFLLVYFIFVLISVAGSSLLYLSIKGFFKTITYIGFYISVVHYLNDNKDKIKYIFLAIAICASYETIFAFLQNFGAVEEISGWQDMTRLNPEEVMTRVYGTIKPYNPNLFGGYMLSIIPAFIALPTINKKFIPISLILGALSCIALILTGCRGAYIGLFIQLILLFLITYKFLKPIYKKTFLAVIGFLTAIVTLIIISTTALRARIFSIFAMRSDSSNSFRFNVYNSCLQMFKDNWLLGIGCGNQNFREIYGLYMKTGFDALSAYNIYLEIAVESGIFALLTFIGFLICNTYNAIKFILKTKNKETLYAIAALTSLAGILTHGIVDTVFFRPQIQFIFWIMIAIIQIQTKQVAYDSRKN